MLELSWTDAMLTLRWWSRNTEIVFFVDFKLVSLLAIPLSCFARWFSYMSLLVVAPRSAAPVVLGHPARSLQQNACLQQLFFLMFYVSITRSFFFDDSNRTSIFLESKNTCELVSRSSPISAMQQQACQSHSLSTWTLFVDTVVYSNEVCWEEKTQRLKTPMQFKYSKSDAYGRHWLLILRRSDSNLSQTYHSLTSETTKAALFCKTQTCQ